jgi:hypothetical protein
MKYQLISSGHLLIEAEETESIARIQQITKLSEEQIRKSLLNGRPRKLLSSDDQAKIKKAALALRRAGLDVEVTVCRPASAKREAKREKGPGDIAPNKEKSRGKERIDTLPCFPGPPKKKSHPGPCRAGLLLFLITLFLIILLYPTSPL